MWNQLGGSDIKGIELAVNEVIEDSSQVGLQPGRTWPRRRRWGRGETVIIQVNYRNASLHRDWNDAAACQGHGDRRSLRGEHRRGEQAKNDGVLHRNSDSAWSAGTIERIETRPVTSSA